MQLYSPYINSKTIQQWKITAETENYFISLLLDSMTASVIIFIASTSKFFSTFLRHDIREFKISKQITLAQPNVHDGRFYAAIVK